MTGNAAWIPDDFSSFVLTISVGEYNEWTFAAKLEMRPFKIWFGARLHDEMTHFRWSGEGDFIHVGMTGQGRTCRLSIARDDLYHTGRKTGLTQSKSNHS